jgi:hypothetical protein
MEIREMFLPEFDLEMKKTRAILERVPKGSQTSSRMKNRWRWESLQPIRRSCRNLEP